MNVLQMIEKTKQFGQAISTLYTERHKEILANTTEYEFILREQQSAMATVNVAWNSVNGEFQREFARRNSAIERAFTLINDELNGINDPHWYRVKEKYYNYAKNHIISDYSEQTADELLAEIEILL